MTRKHAAPSGDNAETSPERVTAGEIPPDAISPGPTVARLQSASKAVDELLEEHPMPPEAGQVEEIDRMLASAETVDHRRALLLQQLTKRQSLGYIAGRRLTLWLAETFRTPRATILGRYLHDNNVTGDHNLLRVIPAEVYEEISRRGPHHLDDTAKKHLASADSSSRASYCSKGIASRAKFLCGQRLADSRGAGRFWLTREGARVFTRWPWWGTKDEEDDPPLDSEPPPPSPPRPGKPKSP